ncbi:MAG: FAD-binding oxidoreductase [Chloroflexota bacterium]|nr:MAG: FAD-binding oxidoreductase [Chloroflexota bacterium]
MEQSPFWLDGLNRPAELKSAPLPARVDVAIVGAGYTGLNAARVLLGHGASAVVLEGHKVGWGASSRNGGMLTTGSKVPPQVMFKRYGRELGREFWRVSLDSIDRVEEVITEHEIDCDFARTGQVALAYKPAHFEAMQKKVTWYEQNLDHALRSIGPGELETELGSKAYFGGLVDESAANLNPAAYVLGLGAAVARAGASLCQNTEVLGIEKSPNGYQIQTSQGVLRARDVLIATNGYTDRLIAGLRRRVFPVGSYIVVTEPLPNDVRRRLSPKNRVYYDSKNFLNYFRLTADGRLLFGGRNDLSTGLDLRQSARRLRRRMLELFPYLEEYKISHSWSGQLGMTFDLMPHIGRINGVYYALGFCGHGVSLATYMGAEAGSLIAGEKKRSPFMEIKHPTRFFYRNRPWFLPLAAQIYRLMDRVS